MTGSPTELPPHLALVKRITPLGAFVLRKLL